jgi:DNA segregation ATPase FtsK/SpoIIIE, S-DNA-T family
LMLGADTGASGRRSAETAGSSVGWSVGGRGARLLNEAAWIAGTLMVLALAAALVSFHRDDPGFSNSVSAPAVQNLVGRAGAWLADSMLVAFGIAAYCWVAAGIAWSARVGRRLFVHEAPASLRGNASHDALARWLRALSLVMLVCSLSGLAALRWYSHEAWLPGSAGGALGDLVAPLVNHAFGFTGATILLLVLVALSASLHFGFSWLRLSERLGGWIEFVAGRAQRRRESQIDRTMGEAALAEREASLAL